MSTRTEREFLAGDVIERRRVSVRGVVQGVGFRPFVARLAADLRLQGHCGNDDSSVFVEVEGPAAAIAEFTRRIRSDAPPMSMIVELRAEPIPVRSDPGFRIIDSRQVAGARTLVPADVAICADCLRELRDPADRRYRHPFVNCTNCGPRFTVIDDLPYDRPSTTMAAFEMCARCRDEYSRPADRRYHAQPICCHDCGPRLTLESADWAVTGDDEVIGTAQRALRNGLIVAVKGIGGFHLACDATSPSAVRRLRERKRRPDKPLAVMAPNLAVAQQVCVLSDAEAGVLQQRTRPIVLVTARTGNPVATEVAPGIDELGIMLPYTPLHHLLFDPVPGSDEEPPALLVMTSGNTSGAPLAYDNADARRRLAGIADMFLMHDREIAVPCEDSVLAVLDGEEMPIRRSRGYAPLPVMLHSTGPVVLAVGAEVKNTFCLTRQDYAFCSAHLGDMGTLESRSAFERSVRQLTTLHRADPEVVVSDDHPGYSTRQWAQRYCDAHDLELRTVQHHHAHVASLMAEHDRLGTRMLGIAFDGTGYGCDRTVWGGELLSVGPDPLSAERVGHLRSFWLPGGDAAVRNPARVALALLHEAGIDDHDLPCSWALPADERALVQSQLRSGTACIRTTSVGRLFDGVASLLGIRHRITYEAQAAIELEARARSTTDAAELTVGIDGDELDFAPLLHGLVAGLRNDEPVERLALGFQHALATATAALADRSARERGVDTIGLTGGVFGNRILTTDLQKHLQGKGFEVLTHHLVPANDGGLSLGQAVLGRALAARDTAAERTGIGAHT